MKLKVGKLFDDKRFLMIFSLLMAIISWLVVVQLIDKRTQQQIQNVPVDVTYNQKEMLMPINLNIVDSDQVKATVVVNGERSVVGGLKPEDVAVYADLSNITSAGNYTDVPLLGRDVNKKGFSIVSIEPETIRIRVDSLTTKTFTITADIDGLDIPEDYLGQPAVINPKVVEITGPDQDIQKIDKCVVSASFSSPLTKTTTVKSDLILYNAEGGQISTELLTMDTKTADITIPVYKQKRLQLAFSYLKVPAGMDTDRLEYTLDPGYVDVAGPESTVDNLDVLDIGYVAVNEIDKGKEFVLDISLPGSLINISGTKSVRLSFDLENMVAADFTIPGSNIIVKNKPPNYDVEVYTSSISGVHMLGEPAVMETLTAQDIVAEIDLSEGEVTPGPYSKAVTISVANKGMAWAVGDYTAVVTIKEKS